MANKINRRKFLKVGGAVMAAGTSGHILASDTTKTTADAKGVVKPRYLRKADLPAAKGPRIVVVGGGWSGLTMAKYLKKQNSQFDVVLMDRNAAFISCPLSNAWMAGELNLDFLTHSYLDAAKNGDYIYLRATAIDLDRESKTLFTDQGSIEYEYLVIAPGIDYDYSRIGVTDPADAQQIYTQYPGGFTNASEYLSIKRKLFDFKGGTLALTVPKGNYRCMAAPYERACMAAAILKKRDIKAKIQVLDMNPDIRIKKDGFRNAFETFYADTIEYVNQVEITAVNLSTKEIETDFDSYGFDDAIIYPPIRASRLIENLGLANPSSPQKEAEIDELKYHLKDDEHVYITGDARPQPFSKSGNTAHSEARYVAEVIAAHAQGKTIEWRSPQTMCFSGVRIDPYEAMSIVAFYDYNKADKTFAFKRVHQVEKWSYRGGQAGLAWAEGIFRDMFYA